MRKLPAVIVSAGLLVTALTACSTAPGASGECAPSGDASALIDVTGAFGSEPDVSFPTPIKTDASQVTTIIEGDGEPIGAEDTIIGTSMLAFDGETGEPIPGVAWNDEPQLMQLPPSMMEALTCQQEGSRVAAVVEGSQDFGLEEGDTVVLVADIDQVVPNRATGADRPVVESGFPSVVTAADGTPGLTIPKSDPPQELKVATLKQGDGQTVEADSTIVAQYTGVLWDEQRVFDSTWTQGVPRPLDMQTMIPGFQEALVGKQVGSQILAVIPPEFGYGDQGNQAVPAGSTLVFVIDILALL